MALGTQPEKRDWETSQGSRALFSRPRRVSDDVMDKNEQSPAY